MIIIIFMINCVRHETNPTFPNRPLRTDGRVRSSPVPTPLIASNEELYEKARVASLELYLKFYAAQTVLEQTEVTSQLLRNEQLTISKDLWAMTRIQSTRR